MDVIEANGMKYTRSICTAVVMIRLVAYRRWEGIDIKRPSVEIRIETSNINRETKRNKPKSSEHNKEKHKIQKE
jgi:hypothetical protein